MDQLIISVHNFLAEVATSSWVDDRHLALAEGLKDEVVTLYSDWDAASGRVRVSLERTEESASKLAEIERELIQFRNSLKSKQLHLAQKSGPKKMRGLKGGSSSSSHDSGISDASSSLLSDYGLPEALEHLARLQQMTRSLELTLSPRDPTLVTITRVLTDTSLELDDLQKMYLRQKTVPPVVRKKTARRKMIGREKVRPSAYPVTSKSSRLGKLARVTLSLQALLMSLLLLSWVCQPQCCDSISAISFSAPTFKFVNGPPPI